MFTLVTDKSKYFRVKRGQSAAEIERALDAPVCARVFEGAVIRISEGKFLKYTAKPGDSYKTVAAKFGADEEELKKLNAFKPVYPTCKLFVPI